MESVGQYLRPQCHCQSSQAIGDSWGQCRGRRSWCLPVMHLPQYPCRAQPETGSGPPEVALCLDDSGFPSPAAVSRSSLPPSETQEAHVHGHHTGVSWRAGKFLWAGGLPQAGPQPPGSQGHWSHLWLSSNLRAQPQVSWVSSLPSPVRQQLLKGRHFRKCLSPYFSPCAFFPSTQLP